MLALAGCAEPPATQVATAAQGSPAPLTTIHPGPSAGVSLGGDNAAPMPARIVRGSGRFIAPARIRADASATPEGDVTLTFAGADVRDAAKAILGDILNLNYAVDPDAAGTVTIETARPIRREDVLATFEVALRGAGLGLVERAGTYTIIPLADARRQPLLLTGEEAGYGTEAVPLRFVAAARLKELLDPLVPEQAITQVDPARNLLLISGTQGDRRSLRELIDQFDVNWLQGMSFALLPLRQADSRRVAAELNEIVNAPDSAMAGLVRLVPIRRLNGILVISPQAEYLDEVRFWLTQLDRESAASDRRIFVYRVQNGRASDLAKVLTSAFGIAKPATASPAAAAPLPPPSATAGGALLDPTAAEPAADGQAQITTETFEITEGQRITITSDDTNNAIVTVATPAEYEVVEQALRQLDVLPLQVLVEAVISEVTLNDTLRYGVQWFLRSGDSSGSLSGSDSGSILANFPGFAYMLQAGNDIRVVLDALDDVTDVKVVSSPQLLVLNNQTASLQVGDQVPVAVQSAVSVDNSTAPIVNSIEFRDTGVILKVTPRVNDSGLVLLDISQEVSDVVATTTSELNSPTIQQRRISSSVAVQDGQTVALGGLIRDSRNEADKGIPGLKDIPGLGLLFGATENSTKRTELLILLTPHVVRNQNDARAITNELREQIRLIEPIPAAPVRPPARPW